VAAWEGVPIEEMIEIARALNFYSAFNIQTGGANTGANDEQIVSLKM